MIASTVIRVRRQWGVVGTIHPGDIGGARGPRCLQGCAGASPPNVKFCRYDLSEAASEFLLYCNDNFIREIVLNILFWV